MTDNALIPCTDELNRLKDFLADFKKPTLRYTGTDHIVVGLGANALSLVVASEIKKIERAKADANFWSWYDY